MFLCLLWASVLIFSMLMQFIEVHLRLRSIEAIEDRPACPSGPISSSNPQLDSDSTNRIYAGGYWLIVILIKLFGAL